MMAIVVDVGVVEMCFLCLSGISVVA
jgi:hypothetical protein